MRIKHERRAHVVRHGRRKNPIQSQPDESLHKLMNCEWHGKRCEKQFAPVLHLGQGDDADGTQNSAAYEIRGG